MIHAWRRLGIRTRITAVGVLAVTLTLTVAAVTLVWIVDAQLSQAARDAVTGRLTDLAAQITTDDKDAITSSIQAVPGDTFIVQVLDASDNILYASPGMAGQPPILAPAGPAPAVVKASLPFLDEDEFWVATQTISVQGRDTTVLVGQATESAESVLHSLEVGCAIGVPLLAATAGLVIWLAVGQSLRSVGGIRQRVEVITSADLHKRVPVPASRDEIRRLAQTMNGMLARLESASVQQRQLVADVSHELKSPLASMRATLDTSTAPDPVLDAEVTRMTRLVADLLTLARSDEGALELDMREIDLDDLIWAEATRLRATTSATVTADGSPVRVLGDHERIEQVLHNLADNAARHARSHVRLCVTADEGGALITCDDDGPGIPEDDRQRVFDRFVRLDVDRSRQTGGSGLGLAICREIVRLHGGRIEVAQSPLGGAQFRVWLPASTSM